MTQLTNSICLASVTAALQSPKLSVGVQISRGTPILNNVQEYIMTDEMKQALKEYLKENLTFENQISSDIYGVNPDQIVLNIKLEGELIATTTLYPLQF